MKNTHSNCISYDYSCFVSIVIPTYQEAENLRHLIIGIAKAVSPLNRPYEVIVVDDNSQDGTDEILGELAEDGYPVRLITRVGERGLSSAVIRGFSEARGKCLVCMDGDLSHPSDAIPRLLEPLDNSEVDLVVGSRYISGSSTDESWGILRWINSKLSTLMARPFTRVRDPMSGFFAVPRMVFDRAALLNPIGYKIGLEIMVKCGCNEIYEVPIHFANRRFGKSKLGLGEQVNYIKHLKRLLDYKYGEFSRLAQFAFVGSTGLVVDLVMFGIFLRTTMSLMLARGLAIWVAMTWNFWANRRLTFSYDRKGNILGQYLRFVMSCGLGAVISWSVSVSLSEIAPLFYRHPFQSAIIGVLMGTLSNFLLSRWWVFKHESDIPLRKKGVS